MHKLHKNRLKEQSRTSATDSLKVAQVFVKEHKNVIRAIRNMLVQAENSTAQNCAAKSWFYETVI